MYNDNEGNRPTKRSKGEIAIAVLAAVFLIVISIWNYTPPPKDKYFSPENFYGTVTDGAEQDPKDMWDRMTKGDTTATKEGCLTTMSSPKDYWNMPNGFTWPNDKKPDGIDTWTEVPAEMIDELSGLKAWSKGDRIIAPSRFTYINQNISDTDPNNITIRGEIPGYRVEIRYVERWWCNIGKADTTTHTKVIGANGVSGDLAIANSILGIATDRTVMYFDDINSDTNQRVSPTEVFITGPSVTTGD